jgi:hypothetical protein
MEGRSLLQKETNGGKHVKEWKGPWEKNQAKVVLTGGG